MTNSLANAAHSGAHLFSGLQGRTMRSAQLRFKVFFSIAVLLVAFFAGIALGLRRNLPAAQALVWNSPLPSELPGDLHLPDGLAVTSIGGDVSVNGKDAEMVSFATSRPVKDVLAEQVGLWEDRGFLALGAATSTRGMALARDHVSGDRYTMTVWQVPAQVLSGSSGSDETQGVASRLRGGEASAGASGETAGEVPGVPLLPGGRGGSVLHSSERGQESYSGVYTNPGGLAQNAEFYQRFLRAKGWMLQSSSLAETQAAGSAALTFQQGRTEVVLLLAEKEDKQNLETVVAVTRCSTVGRLRS